MDDPSFSIKGLTFRVVRRSRYGEQFEVTLPPERPIGGVMVLRYTRRGARHIVAGLRRALLDWDAGDMQPGVVYRAANLRGRLQADGYFHFGHVAHDVPLTSDELAEVCAATRKLVDEIEVEAG